MTDDEEKNAGKKPAEEIIAERYKMEGREAAQKVLKKRREEIGDHGTTLITTADDMDEAIMTEQLVGVTPLVYHIGDKLELSWKGLTRAARKQQNLHILEVVVIEEAGRLVGKAKARDVKNNVEMVGVADRYTSEEFKYVTLASKAIRNALKKLIDPVVEQEVIKEAETAESIVVIRPGSLKNG